MIVRKLAAFFTLIAFVVFAMTWLVRRLSGLPTADVTALFSQGCVIIFAFFIIGIFLAKMGIALVNEVLESKHRQEEEKRERARNLYLTAISGGKPLGLEGGFSRSDGGIDDEDLLSEIADEVASEK